MKFSKNIKFLQIYINISSFYQKIDIKEKNNLTYAAIPPPHKCGGIHCGRKEDDEKLFIMQ
jgi:hypothetical protein